MRLIVNNEWERSPLVSGTGSGGHAAWYIVAAPAMIHKPEYQGLPG